MIRVEGRNFVDNVLRAQQAAAMAVAGACADGGRANIDLLRSLSILLKGLTGVATGNPPCDLIVIVTPDSLFGASVIEMVRAHGLESGEWTPEMEGIYVEHKKREQAD